MLKNTCELSVTVQSFSFCLKKERNAVIKIINCRKIQHDLVKIKLREILKKNKPAQKAGFFNARKKLSNIIYSQISICQKIHGFNKFFAGFQIKRKCKILFVNSGFAEYDAKSIYNF